MGEPAEAWNKAERLAVAGAVAPHLRSQAEQAAKRRVAKVDKDGNVVGYTTLAEVQKALLLTHKIEFDVVEGTRPIEIFCEKCGRPTKVPKKGGIPKQCRKCACPQCVGCGSTMSYLHSTPSFVAKRKGAPPKCTPCKKKDAEAERPRCAGCSKVMGHRQLWQHRVRFKRTDPLRCRKCVDADRRSQPGPPCGVCGKELRKAAKYSVRAKSGKPPMCGDCYRGEARAEVAREKMKADPKFAAKVKRAMRKGATAWSKQCRAKKAPPPIGGGE
jgi:hypothetical protein